jgi:hypothetical protein
MHLRPSTQAVPQLPQLLASICVLVQTPPHFWPKAQVHIDDEQISPVAHAAPQALQLSRSFARLVQKPVVHSAVGATQVHAPATHALPPVQVTPHPPQFDPSVAVFTQEPAQLTVPAGQLAVHALAEQT